ncbi:FxsA family protein [Dongia sp.]|uniref:FxsA family protein n=1 Tax=Dongia sp. TaxID=1977262 RepID=UPI003750C25C
MTRFVTLTAVMLPFLEIPGFVLVSYWIGVIPMLGLVVLGVILGIMVIQRVGLNAVVNLRLAVARGEEPGHSLIDAACFALGGFLLTIPGFISDIIALFLFLPWTRNYLLRRAARHFDVKVYGSGFGARPEPRTGAGMNRGGVIEGEYSIVDSDVDPEAPEPDQPRLKDGSSGT